MYRQVLIFSRKCRTSLYMWVWAIKLTIPGPRWSVLLPDPSVGGTNWCTQFRLHIEHCDSRFYS